MQITFEKERDTKNKVRFTEKVEDGNAVVGTLYVSQEAVKELDSDTLTVTIEGE